MIRGAGPCLGGGGGGALGLCLCLLRWPPRDLTPANRAPFGVSAVATTVVMSARRIALCQDRLVNWEETTSDNPLRAEYGRKEQLQCLLLLKPLSRLDHALLVMQRTI